MIHLIIFMVILNIFLWAIKALFFKLLIPLKGKLGELKVKKRLPKGKNDILLNDVYLNDTTGLSQVDHILISRKGIYSIETKNYKGSIKGSADDVNWVQNRRNKFYNPLKQNAKHVQRIQNVLNLPVSNVVFFVGKAKLHIRDCDDKVFKSFKRFRRYLRKQKNIYSKEELKEIADKLIASNVTNKSERKAYIDYVKDVKKAKKSF